MQMQKEIANLLGLVASLKDVPLVGIDTSASLLKEY